MNLDDALQTFITESRDLLQDMESALLTIEQSPEDPDLINALFRTAHTIKGSAGLFGLDDVVAFTHVMENVLDRVRNGSLKIDPELSALMLDCSDHLTCLVDGIESKQDTLSAEDRAIDQALVARLGTYLDAEFVHKQNTSKAGKSEATLAPPDADGTATAAEHWHISLRCGRDLLRNGMDPFSIIRYLGTLGEVVHLITLIDAIPSREEMDPESCYLDFEISLKSNADKAVIEGAFEFIHADSQIRILPPRSRLEDYKVLLAEQEEQQRIGELLVACGSLTRRELEMVIDLQMTSAADQPRPIGELLIAEQLVQPDVVEAALSKQKQNDHGSKVQTAKTLRVDAEKLDELINLIGELVIASAGVNQIASELKSSRMQEAAATINRLVEEVRDSSLALRMVQVGETFNRFHRVVRDVSKELGKDIALVVNGGETELDKSVVEKIGDPLMHLIRNSMDHGIEPAEVRKAAGKPAQGRVELNAYHDSGSVVIEVVDDGGGLNRERILAKAIERGLIQADQPMTDDETFALIFEAGFSTAQQITNLSGRGVGMDVVRQNIQSLRGSVHVSSQAGAGTCFTIRLPLTLAIIDGFLIETGPSAFVIPLDSVVECIELEQGSLDRHYLNLRGEVLPYVSLRELFEIQAPPPQRENIVVVRIGALKIGIVVDALRGEFQTVIKPLGTLFRHLRGISGSTILGSGAVALILDVVALGDIAAKRESETVVGTAVSR